MHPTRSTVLAILFFLLGFTLCTTFYQILWVEFTSGMFIRETNLTTINLLNDNEDQTRLETYNWSTISDYERQKLDSRAARFAINEQQKCNTSKAVHLCSCMPQSLKGQLYCNFTIPSWEEVEDVVRGQTYLGSYKPTHCTSNQRVAIIIPYREREAQLRVFLRHIHPILQRQLNHYIIVVVELPQNSVFNRAIGMNIGFQEADRIFQADCYVFHDVDLLAEDDRLMYKCDQRHFVHLSQYIDKHRYNPPYDTLVGGALAIPRATFLNINGYSNQYYGWGGEDDDLYNRLDVKGFTLIKPPKCIGRYHAVKHSREKENVRNLYNHVVLKRGRKKLNVQKDGINTLKYHVTKLNQFKTHIHIHANAVTALLNYTLTWQVVQCNGTDSKRRTASLVACAENCDEQHACHGFRYIVKSKTNQCEFFQHICWEQSPGPERDGSHVIFLKRLSEETMSALSHSATIADL